MKSILQKRPVFPLVLRLIFLLILVVVVRNVEIETLGRLGVIFATLSLLIVFYLFSSKIMRSGPSENYKKYILPNFSLRMLVGTVTIIVLFLMGELNALGFYFPLVALLGIFSFPLEERRVDSEDLKISLLLIFPFTAFLAFSGEDIIFYLFGERFQGAVFPFQILVWTLILIFLNYFLWRFLISQKKLKFSLIALLFGIFSATLLNFYLIPKYGLEGASLATLITEALIFLLFIISFKVFKIRIPFRKCSEKPLVSTLGMMVVLHYFHPLPFLFQLVLGIASYVASILVLSFLELK